MDADEGIDHRSRRRPPARRIAHHAALIAAMTLLAVFFSLVTERFVGEFDPARDPGKDVQRTARVQAVHPA